MEGIDVLYYLIEIALSLYIYKNSVVPGNIIFLDIRLAMYLIMVYIEERYLLTRLKMIHTCSPFSLNCLCLQAIFNDTSRDPQMVNYIRCLKTIWSQIETVLKYFLPTPLLCTKLWALQTSLKRKGYVQEGMFTSLVHVKSIWKTTQMNVVFVTSLNIF